MRILKVLFVLSAFVGIASADGTTIYNTIPSPLPPNVVSEPYEAVQSYEFGNLIGFAGTARSLTDVVVAMSNWAYESNWPGVGTAAGFDVPLTLNLYNVGSNNSVGSLIASDTVDALIPWRPEPDPTDCPTNAFMPYRANGQCYNGSLSTVTFDFTGTVVPNSIIYGLEFNTTDYGLSPTVVAGPYDSLNVALSSTAPSVGSNPLPGAAYFESITASQYGDGGAGGVGTFRLDPTGWAPYSGAIQFEAAVPEPDTTAYLSVYLLMGLGVALVARRQIRRKA